ELEKRQLKVAAAPSAAQDLVVLQFALLLEQLESTFYQQGLTKFGADAFTAAGIPVAVRNQFQVILLDELTHVSFLQQVITKAGAVPNLPCTFNFAAALATVQSFVTFAAILERTGVQAYDGAIHLVTPNTGTAGAAIATVEGRHSSFLNLLTLGNAAPGPFDTPLGIRPIVSIAAPLITTCPAG
ncbi:ferritin-like domain-containing protein, partial [Zopfochytrium polystomum]